jgi:hypothetical protein
VHSLAELQAEIGHAVTSGGATPAIASLVGGARPAKRLAIHQGHYEASLAAALLAKFPASAWLAGTAFVTEAARAYAHACPPPQPCIAEYGRDFPAFLARFGRTAPPYLQSFAALELAVGEVSIAVDVRPLRWAELASVAAEELLESALTLQPGLRHLRAPWRIDELMTTYLRGEAPERFVLAEGETHVEVRGARGSLRLLRLDGATFVFRTELVAGRTIAKAAELALDVAADFDAGAALRALVHAGLVVAHRGE